MTWPAFRLPLMFGAASLVAVLAGCWAASLAGVPTGVWARMVVAWAIGLTAALLLSRVTITAPPRAGLIIVATVVLLGLVWTDAGLQGVHRWIVIGPLRLNMAALALPLAIILLAEVAWAPIAMFAIMLLIVAQPDASQATGFGLAAIILLVLGTGQRGRFVGLWCAGIVMLVGIAWLRPDPLGSVPEVEGIVALAWGQAPVLAIVAVAALGLAAVAPLASAVNDARHPAAAALAVYLLVTAASPAIGAFPVPLVGMSMSPIIGFWLGIGALLARNPDQ